MNKKRSGDLQLIGRLIKLARPFWLQIILIFILSLLSTPLALLTPVPLAIAVDSVVDSKPLPGVLNTLFPQGTLDEQAILMLAAAMTVGIALATGLLSLTKSMVRTYTGENLILAFRSRLFRHAQDLSLSYHDSRGSSDALYRVMYDATSIADVAIDGLAPFVTAAFTLVAMFWVIFEIDAQIALVALAIAPVLFLTGYTYRRQSRSKWREVKKLDRAALAVVQETLSAVRVVKAFGQENRQSETFSGRSKSTIRARISAYFITYGYSLISSLVTAIGTAIVLVLGVNHVLTGVISLGAFLIIMSYLGRLYSPMDTMTQKLGKMQSSLAGAERAVQLLDEPPDVQEKQDALPLKRVRGAIRFEDVSFAYDSRNTVLQHISFDVPAGTRVGIVGQTGAGKSTMMGLLARFYDPTSGAVLLDDIDIRNYKLADLRKQYAIVLQEPVLFSTSIAENIAYARHDATEADIIRAAKAANAHEFVSNLPDGYETLVGERGMKLSGGERQRISLARAFLKDAPILILDEPTSSVDVGTEAVIVEAMERLMQNRTTFMIAHRLSTLEKCDLLLVIEAGQLIDVRSDVSSVIEYAIEEGGFESSKAGTVAHHV
ncbi:MAG: ABC transporter ATP-binding protein/permease [Anaerolineae bacterium]|nr:ABC transporter ATP-binding protein/permease [Anaerolineae bacterium]